MPNTADMDLEEAGGILRDGGFVNVDRVSCTPVRGVYAPANAPAC